MSGKKNEAEHRNFNITRLDSKGRITVPFHIREYMGIKDGSEFLIINNENKEMRVFPLLKGKIAYLKLVISDKPGSLSKVLNSITKYDLDILTSTSKSLERGKSAEWTAIVDISMCKNIKRLEQELSELTNIVKKIDVSVE